jgi:hypothetical protein
MEATLFYTSHCCSCWRDTRAGIIGAMSLAQCRAVFFHWRSRHPSRALFMLYACTCSMNRRHRLRYARCQRSGMLESVGIISCMVTRGPSVCLGEGAAASSAIFKNIRVDIFSLTPAAPRPNHTQQQLGCQPPPPHARGVYRPPRCKRR